MRSAIETERIGIPSVTVAATSFLPLVRSLSISEGMPGLRVAEYPGTWSVESKKTMKDQYKAVTFDRVVNALTKPLGIEEVGVNVNMPKAIVATGSLEEINAYFHRNRWTDGFAIIPPTINRIEEFLKYTDRPPQEEIAILPPGNLRATPWNIAANGVMAGCKPEHMPLLIASVEAIGDPAFNLEQIGTTGGVNLFFLVNGPIVKQLGLANGQGLISLGANPVLGRALGLMRANIAGFRAGEQYAGTFGYSLPFVLAENEEALYAMGWEPYHVEHGFDKESSTVTAGGTNSWGNQTFPSGTDPEGLLKMLARNIVEHHALGVQATFPGLGMETLLVTPNVAKVIAGTHSKQKTKEYLQENARYTLEEYNLGSLYGDGSGIRGLSICEKVEKGELPQEWLELGPHDDAGPILPSPDMIHIIVCGDPTRNKGQAMWSWYNVPTTKKISLPANWEEVLRSGKKAE